MGIATYSREQFKAVLQGLGYLPPERTAPFSPPPSERLLQAIQAFQLDYRLSPTGNLDATTQERARQLIRNLHHNLNLALNAQLSLSEFYSTTTAKAVEAFQRQHALPITGIATAEFRHTLDEVVKRQMRSRFHVSSANTSSDFTASAMG